MRPERLFEHTLIPGRRTAANDCTEGHLAMRIRIGESSVSIFGRAAVRKEQQRTLESIAVKRPRKLAAIDVGTNSIHMIVVQAQRHGYRVVDREKEMVQLGRGSLGGDPLTEDAMERGISALRKMREIATQWDASEILGVATSAVREAPNRRAFLNRVENDAGIRLRLISGEEEADYIYRAVRAAVEFQGGTAFIIDIGGGSVELIVGTDHEVYFSRSIPLGSLRLSQQFFSKDLPDRASVAKCREHIRETLGKSARRIRKLGFDFCIGTSGTILTLSQLGGEGEGDVASGLRWLRRSELNGLVEKLTTTPRSDYTSVLGVDPKRSETILGGAILLQEILQLVEVNKLRACTAALREGIVERALEDSHDPSSERRHTVRRRSVLELAERGDYDRIHATQVARLALRIYDQTQKLHELRAADRELLEYAALLHEIGLHVSYQSHHKHTYYMIRHAGLKGFTDDQVAVIANVARYYRKGLPSEKHENFAELRANQRRSVLHLSAILRIASALDRSRKGAVRDVGVDITNRKIRFFVRPRFEAQIEIEDAKRKSKLLSSICQRKVRFVVQSQERRTSSRAVEPS